MGQALYRKYRSRSFEEVVGQEHITKTLRQAIKAGRISHAYLFTGPRGVGKTSIARILAHEVNELPYKDDSVHLDIIEIDAASNRRIDEVRDLRDKVRIAPAAARYKVYIIDEVHMLTREAFNALLKTLEEPPAHCIFILATTEAHKLPETIVSRTQRFEFKTIAAPVMAGHLADIAKKEKINIDKAALELLAEFGQGSFRDSIGYLDQLSSLGKKITEDDVRELLGMPSAATVSDVLAAVSARDMKALSESLENAAGKGAGAAELASSIAKKLRSLASEGKASAPDIKLLKELAEVKASSRPQELLEIVLLQAAAPDVAPPPVNTATASVPKAKKEEKTVEAKVETTETTVVQETEEVREKSEFELDSWGEVLDAAKQRAASIYTALRLARPSLDGNHLVLAFEFPLHQKKLDQAKNKAMVAEIIEQLCGSKLIIESVVDKSVSSRREEEPEPVENPAISSITNIFGTAEMIET
ncbi:MAG TPA: DNA polymerase III subunit gamma/tau [Candidatus Saccharimonadales bacterium]|nr:DNA polymerase III subunit gamma/tau [Candidatus Saccharimonadales bacterium]